MDQRKELLQLNRVNWRLLWQKARKNDLEGLDEEQRRLAEAMLAHADEYFNQFEFADVTADKTFDPGEVNPFLHVSLHAVVENQIRDRDPIEALQFYNAMLKQKCSRHEAVHLLIGILVPLIFGVLAKNVPFQNEKYRQLLRRYKTHKPEKIARLLEDDPELDPHD